MVHFHIHTNGTDTEEIEGSHKVVPTWIIRSVWFGLAVMLWTLAIFLIVTAIHEIVK